jgi:protease-4
MKKFLLGLVAGLVLAGLSVFILFFILVRLGDRRPVIFDGSTLVLRLEGEMGERPGVEIPLPMFEEPHVTVQDTWSILKKAAVDPKIKAILLMPAGIQAGWGKLSEIRGGLIEFKKSGKPVYAWLRTPRMREYYVASAADKIYLAPEDVLDVRGLRAEILFVKGTLDKLGIQAEIEHAGKYKDAGDMLTRTSMTPETREVMNSILDGIYANFVQAVGTSRKKKPEQVMALVDQGPFLPKNAMANGLIDGLYYEDQVFGELKKAIKQEDIKKVSHRDYARVPAGSLGLEGKRKIAFVVGDGPIVRGGNPDPFGNDEGIGSDSFIRLLRRVAQDNSIQGVIIRIDSPGGDAMASDDILREVKLLSQRKPVVFSMSDVAASGGYYMALTGDSIVAYPNTLTGSIGVIYGKMNVHGLYDKLGVTKDIITRGRFADLDSDYQPLTDVGRQKLRESIDHVYKGFVSRVAEARKRKYEEIDALAQGRVWLGSQARQNGLVDETGGLDKAIEIVKKKANIGPGEKIRLVPYPAKRNFLDLLMERSNDSSESVMEALAASKSTALWKRVLGNFQWRLWIPGGLMRMAPYEISIQ